MCSKESHLKVLFERFNVEIKKYDILYELYLYLL